MKGARKRGDVRWEGMKRMMRREERRYDKVEKVRGASEEEGGKRKLSTSGKKKKRS